MTSSCQISDLEEIKWNLYFWKAHDKSHSKIQFLSILDRYFKSYGNINAIWPLLAWARTKYGHIKSYWPLNFRKSHQISWFCCIPNRSYKNTIWRRVESAPIWNRVKIVFFYLAFSKDSKDISYMGSTEGDFHLVWLLTLLHFQVWLFDFSLKKFWLSWWSILVKFWLLDFSLKKFFMTGFFPQSLDFYLSHYNYDFWHFFTLIILQWLPEQCSKSPTSVQNLRQNTF